MTLDEERSRAAEARHGGRLMTHGPALWRRIAVDALAAAAQEQAAGRMHVYWGLPQSCFDWPIYRAAMGLDQPEGKGARK